MNRFRVGLLGAIVWAALVTPVGPVRAQATYRCVDKEGEVHVGQGTPPASCQEETRIVPKALLDRPMTAKEVEDVKGYLNQKLLDLARVKEGCGGLHERIEEVKDDALDAVDEKADNRRSGRVSRGERRTVKKIERSAATAHFDAQKCEESAQQQIEEVNAILSSPEKFRAELPALRVAKFRYEEALARKRAAATSAEEHDRARARAFAEAAEERRIAQERAAAQLSEEFGQQLRGLLANGRGASEILATGPYNAFAARVRAIAHQSQSIRVKYIVPLRNGDHKLLGAAVSEACNALYAVEADWRTEQRAAADLASAQEAVESTRARGGTPLRQLRGLEAAQQQYEQAKTRLAASTESVTRLMAQAMKATGGNR